MCVYEVSRTNIAPPPTISSSYWYKQQNWKKKIKQGRRRGDREWRETEKGEDQRFPL